ncbi:MAG: HmuY family protein [Reichenbachiella sp.]
MIKNKLVIGILSATIFVACEEEKVTPPLSTEENEMQVPLHGSPEVFAEGFNHATQQIEQIPLSYNRQVFIDLDAVSETSNADTLGLHYNDDAYTAFDIWEDGQDVADGMVGWDIVLAHYNGRTEDPGTGEDVPYMVTGALINKGVVKALKITTDSEGFVSYATLTYQDAVSLTLSEEVDVIGSDWKVFDFATYLYQIVEDQYYVIETTDGVFFKLVFTSFYCDVDGSKGFPKFKFERLIAE